MIRIIAFLVLIALLALGAAWIADQPGNVVVTWNGGSISPSLPVFILLLAITLIVALLVWSILRGLWRAPARVKRAHRERRHARGRHAITHGLIAIGTGDTAAARRHAQIARRDAHQEPLALLLHAQTAQLEGDREGARRAFVAMAEREETRLLGLRGLFVEAQRADDPAAAVAIAQEALKVAPASPWASHAILGFRCASGDWDGALAILAANSAAGQIDKAVYRRERAVLLTARALEHETRDRDQARENVLEAVKLAPTLVPAAVLAGTFLSEAHQIRRAMRVIETAWVAQPHPDLADAYAHVRLGDSARQRLVRIETLASKTPGNIEGALALARAAIDASEFAKARDALTPFVAAPTQRVAMLMAEIERAEHGDDGRARSWTLRAVRAAQDPVWTADGYVSQRWHPVSPVTGRLDAFQWQTPLAALPSHVADEQASARAELDMPPEKQIAPPRGADADETAPASIPIEPASSTASHDHVTAQDNLPRPPMPSQPPAQPEAAPAVFRSRGDLGRPQSNPAPIIPIVRAPDDPGVEDVLNEDEFADPLRDASNGQLGGWRGFLARWGG